jgi:hypothetical protein
VTTAVHHHARLTTRQTESSSTLTTKQTISAATLASAGFANNDEALVLWWVDVGTSDAVGIAQADVKYGGATIWDIAAFTWDLGATGRERAWTMMARVALGTLGDFEVQLADQGGATAWLEKSELLIIRLADFGVEDTDWFWDRSTTSVLHTTTYSGTSRASVTWSPGVQEDWVYFATIHHRIESVLVNTEARVTLDGSLDSGDHSIEGEAAVEEIGVSWWGYLASLSAASHTLAMETRDDTATAANRHLTSSIFVFRKAVWTDIFTHLPGTVAVANASDVQVATITDTLSASQPLVVWGQGNLNLDTVDMQGYLWLRQAGSTVVDPVVDTSSGLASGYSYDDTDEVPVSLLAYLASASGALDLDLFASHTDSASRNLLSTGLLVWGLGASVTVQIVYPDADVTTTGWTTTPLWSKIDDDPASPDGTVISATAS